MIHIKQFQCSDWEMAFNHGNHLAEFTHFQNMRLYNATGTVLASGSGFQGARREEEVDFALSRDGGIGSMAGVSGSVSAKAGSKALRGLFTGSLCIGGS